MSHFELRTKTNPPREPLLVHIPHSSIAIPTPWRAQLVLDDSALDRERLAMTDRYTDELFAPAALACDGAAFVNNLSRLVFDPERFEDDALEPMSAIGMGAVYTKTSQLEPLRGPQFSEVDRERILRDLFRPYAAAFEGEVARRLDRFGRCLILDAHSFPARALPYEDPTRDRPDLCLGYDEAHGPAPTVAALESVARNAGWRVGHNTPFAGSYVPRAYYKSDPRVVSIMLEINRNRYMDEETGARSADFDETREMVARLVETALLFEAFRNTSFQADTPNGPVCIRVGQLCAELDALLEREEQKTWAFITAYNPDGKPASGEANERAQAELKTELSQSDHRIYSGAGRGDIGDWPPEPSLLALGVSEANANELGRRYGQAAVVVGKRGEEARLLPLV